MKKYIFLAVILALSIRTYAVTNTVTIDITKDSYVCSYSSYVDRNFGTSTVISANAWTNGGVPYVERGLLEIDLGSIPSNAIINSATLYLYGVDLNPLTKSNASYLRRVTDSWREDQVTWNNNRALPPRVRSVWPNPLPPLKTMRWISPRWYGAGWIAVMSITDLS